MFFLKEATRPRNNPSAKHIKIPNHIAPMIIAGVASEDGYDALTKGTINKKKKKINKIETPAIASDPIPLPFFQSMLIF